MMARCCVRIVRRAATLTNPTLVRSSHFQWPVCRAQCRRQHTAHTEDRQHAAFLNNVLSNAFEPAPEIEKSPVRKTQSLESAPLSPIELQATAMLQEKNALKTLVNGVQHSFDPIFLRDCCFCRECRDPDSGQKKFDTYDIPDQIYPRTITSAESGTLTIQWGNDIAGFSADHTTLIPAHILKSRVSPWRLPPSSQSRPWAATQLKKHSVDYNEYMTNPKATSRVLRVLQLRGIVFIDNVPKSEKSVEEIGERIGPLRDTFYGRTWDVKDKPRAENVAYTAQHLGLHMDLLYMKNPPGFQLLHCIQSSAQGGISLFSDSYKAAEIIAKVSPEHFNSLATFPVTYNYRKQGKHYIDDKPVFELLPFLQHPYRLPLAEQLQAVNWSPPFQALLRHNCGTNDDSRTLRHWLQAAKAFKAVISSPDLTYEHKMKPGECVIFNNRRIMHGRTAFESNIGNGLDAADAAPRWLKGTYIDTDVFQSAVKEYSCFKPPPGGKSVDWNSFDDDDDEGEGEGEDEDLWDS